MQDEERDDKVFEAESEIEKVSLFTPITRTDDQRSIASDSMPVALVDVQQSSVNTQLNSGEEILHVRITREPGTGLGISIAGGIGSSPYKDNDQVMYFCCYSLISYVKSKLYDSKLRLRQ